MQSRSLRTPIGLAAVLGPLVLVAGCSPSGPKLESDIPLRSTAYLIENPQEMERLGVICEQWKGSQEPPMSWPSVVVQTCNNLDFARQMLRRKKDTEKLRRELGV